MMHIPIYSHKDFCCQVSMKLHMFLSLSKLSMFALKFCWSYNLGFQNILHRCTFSQILLSETHVYNTEHACTTHKRYCKNSQLTYTVFIIFSVTDWFSIWSTFSVIYIFKHMKFNIQVLSSYHFYVNKICKKLQHNCY